MQGVSQHPVHVEGRPGSLFGTTMLPSSGPVPLVLPDWVALLRCIEALEVQR